MELKRLHPRHKNNKFAYYVKNYLRLCIPCLIYREKFKQILDVNYDEKYIHDRVNYYNKLPKNSPVCPQAKSIKNLKLKDGSKTYVFDFKEYTRYFDPTLMVGYEYGDVTFVPEYPGFVKSRPLTEDNTNSILLKWNKVRHFTFLNKDKKKFRDKKNQLVFRGRVRLSLQNRIDFIKKYIDHPQCNVGSIDKADMPPEWVVDRMTIGEQLQYKFILSLEGNDVASNLKWIMSSNSLAVMRRPRFETWFMEGQLIPDYHYVLIKDDYSDLEEKLNYYIDNPDKAEQIIQNANTYVKVFQNKKQEDIISLLVLKKYFENTNQCQFQV